MIATWFDHGVITDLQRSAGASFDVRGESIAFSFGYIAVAAGVLAIAVAGWWARSTLLGIIYTVVGGFLASLLFTLWQFACNDERRPADPARPLADAISQLYVTATGPLNAVFAIVGGMFLVGVAMIASGVAREMKARRAILPSAAPGVTA